MKLTLTRSEMYEFARLYAEQKFGCSVRVELEKSDQEKTHPDDSGKWYPDDSGKWVEVDPCSTHVPVDRSARVEVLIGLERFYNEYKMEVDFASNYGWDVPAHDMYRILAYKVVECEQ